MLKFIQNIISTFLFFIGKNSLPINPSLKAHIKLSALVTEISGKVGGSVFSKGKKGNQLKTKRSGGGTQPYSMQFGGNLPDFIWSGCMAVELAVFGYVLPDGSYQRPTRNRNIRSNISQVSKAWQNLLQSDREAWSAMALKFPSKNSLGEIKTKSGYNFYLAINSALLSTGLSPLARPSCSWETINVADPPLVYFISCYVCGGETQYCIEIEKDTGLNAPRTRLNPYFHAGGDSGYLVIYASAPKSKGKTSGKNKKIIAILKKTENYRSFIISLMLNSFYGKNIYDNNIEFSYALVNSGGALALSQPYTLDTSLIAAYKILYTIKQEIFEWFGSDTTLDFGSCATGATVYQTILIYGITLPVLSSYTVTVAASDGTAKFTGVYGDPLNPLDTDTLFTDKYGNILPIPLRIAFNPLSAGAKTGTATVTCGSEVLTINLTGIGT